MVLQRLSIPLNYYEISQNNNGHCYQDFIFLLHMHCFENYLLSYKTCFVLNVTSLFWKLLCLDDLIYLISYVLKALSNFTHESVLKTDRQTDRPTDRPTDRQTDRPTDRLLEAPSRSLKNQPGSVLPTVSRFYFWGTELRSDRNGQVGFFLNTLYNVIFTVRPS